MVNMDADAKLMLAFKSGDVKAFELLAEKYTKPLVNFIYRLTFDRAQAEDIAQEVFVKVYRAAKNYSVTSKFSTFLYKIAYNACMDYFRKKSRSVESKSLSLDAIMEKTETSPQIELVDKSKQQDALIIALEQEAQIRGALASLHPRQSAAISMRIYEEKTYEEIAEVLGISKSAVETLLFRAKQALKQKLK